MVNKLLIKLSQNLLEVLNDKKYCDITIEVGTGPHVKIFRAHIYSHIKLSFFLLVTNFINQQKEECQYFFDTYQVTKYFT